MARVYKISAYIVDCNDEFDDDSLEGCLVYNTQDNLDLRHLNIKSADIGEWYDEHPLNYTNAPIKTFENYFEGSKNDK